MAKVMIYGATGYTGGLISEQAKKAGLDFVIAGRTKSSLQELGTKLSVTQFRAFDLNDSGLIARNLDGITTLLNCAGPFSRTAEPLIQACIRNGVHYLDTSAELDTYRFAEQNDAKAKAANVMLLPGCGGSVAMFGCLVSRALENLQDVQSVDLALHVSGSMSRGSAITASESSTAKVYQRHNGFLVAQEGAGTAQFDFADGRGPVECFPVTLPDIVTIHNFLGVKNISTYANASGSAFPTGHLDTLPDGPTTEEKNANPYHAAVTVTMEDGSIKSDVVSLANGYTMIAAASADAARRVQDGEFWPGFQTSVAVFGSDFM